MICTNIEQSQQLVRLGLDPVTADMCFEMEKGNWTLNVGKKSAQVNRGLAIPAWSLSALLEVMPPFIKGHHLKIEKTRITDMWYLDYQYLTDSEPRKDLLTAAYEMACWLLEQGLIKKENKK